MATTPRFLRRSFACPLAAPASFSGDWWQWRAATTPRKLFTTGKSASETPTFMKGGIVLKTPCQIRLDKLLLQERPNIPFSLVQKLIRTKKVRVRDADGVWAKMTRPSTLLEAGACVHVYSKTYREAEPEDLRERNFVLTRKQEEGLRASLIYSNQHFFVLNKPSGLAVQGGSKIRQYLDGMLYCLAHEDGERPRLIHRLDRETSGCLVVARTREAAVQLGRAFRERLVGKTYLALVSPAPDRNSGSVSTLLAKRRPASDSGSGPERMMVVGAEVADAREAATDFEVLSRRPDALAALVALRPLHGRTHQLRVHCTDVLACPILGDPKYSHPGGLPHETQALLGSDPLPLCLHAARLELALPSAWLQAPGPAPLASFVAACPPHLLLAARRLGLSVPSAFAPPPPGHATD